MTSPFDREVWVDAAERRAFYKIVNTRRDTRSEFTGEPVANAVIWRILAAGHAAPSVGFMQPWDFVVVRSRETRRQLRDEFERCRLEAAEAFAENRRERYLEFKLEGILESSLGILVTCDRTRTGKAVIGRHQQPRMDDFSAVCAVSTMWLAARAENLGFGWVSILRPQVVREIFGVPGHIEPIAYICLGPVKGLAARPDLEAAGWLPRLDLTALVHEERFGQAPEGLLAREGEPG